MRYIQKHEKKLNGHISRYALLRTQLQNITNLLSQSLTGDHSASYMCKVEANQQTRLQVVAVNVLHFISHLSDVSLNEGNVYIRVSGSWQTNYAFDLTRVFLFTDNDLTQED